MPHQLLQRGLPRCIQDLQTFAQANAITWSLLIWCAHFLHAKHAACGVQAIIQTMHVYVLGDENQAIAAIPPLLDECFATAPQREGMLPPMGTLVADIRLRELAGKHALNAQMLAPHLHCVRVADNVSLPASCSCLTAFESEWPMCTCSGLSLPC